jgi:hypothetical protein
MVDSKIALVTASSLLARCSPFGFAFYNKLMNTPNRTIAATFPRYAAGEVVAYSASLQWKELFVRRYRFPNVVDRFLVPATPEPLISLIQRFAVADLAKRVKVAAKQLEARLGAIP